METAKEEEKKNKARTLKVRKQDGGFQSETKETTKKGWKEGRKEGRKYLGFCHDFFFQQRKAC